MTFSDTSLLFPSAIPVAFPLPSPLMSAPLKKQVSPQTYVGVALQQQLKGESLTPEEGDYFETSQTVPRMPSVAQVHTDIMTQKHTEKRQPKPANLLPEKPTSVLPSGKPFNDETLKAHLTSSDPMLHGLTRFVGYLDEIYEASIGTLASVMSFYNRYALKATPERIKQASAGKVVQGLDMESNYAAYVDKLFPLQLKTLAFLNTAVYALSNVYCMGDSAVTGYRGYKLMKQQAKVQKAQHQAEGTKKRYEKTDRAMETRAVMKGVQLTLGQYVFHYLASYTLPPLVIRDIVYKNIKWLGEMALKAAPASAKKHFTSLDTLLSFTATAASVASMPIVAKYLDPMCEKFAEEYFYKPTNKLLDAWYPVEVSSDAPSKHATRTKGVLQHT
ncbi:MAG: hypothetical protein ACKO37_04965 [Vampirovibrionales bacterium]